MDPRLPITCVWTLFIAATVAWPWSAQGVDTVLYIPPTMHDNPLATTGDPPRTSDNGAAVKNHKRRGLS